MYIYIHIYMRVCVCVYTVGDKNCTISGHGRKSDHVLLIADAMKAVAEQSQRGAVKK